MEGVLGAGEELQCGHAPGGGTPDLCPACARTCPQCSCPPPAPSPLLLSSRSTCRQRPPISQERPHYGKVDQWSLPCLRTKGLKITKKHQGRPWWSGSSGPALQSRGSRSIPALGTQIPPAVGQLGPHAQYRAGLHKSQRHGEKKGCGKQGSERPRGCDPQLQHFFAKGCVTKPSSLPRPLPSARSIRGLSPPPSPSRAESWALRSAGCAIWTRPGTSASPDTPSPGWTAFRRRAVSPRATISGNRAPVPRGFARRRAP